MIESKSIYFRLAEVSDAEFILGLRLNNGLNRYLSNTDASLESQRNWLMEYKSREKSGNEYYFVIVRKDTNIPIGVVRLYDFIIERNSFCWGSWILNSDKTRTAAIESALLVYEYAFRTLNFSRAHFDVRKDNISVVKFHKKLGAVEVGETKDDILFEYSLEEYESFYNLNKKYIETTPR